MRAFLRRAPGLLGAFFVGLTLLQCRQSSETEDWQGNLPPAESAPATTTPEPSPPPPPPRKALLPPATETSPDPAPSTADLPQGLRFVAYNVENWLVMDRQVNGKNQSSAPKPDREKAAVIKMILTGSPDILGLCEIGGESDARDIQQRLAAAGHPMAHLYVTGGSDPTRKLALLSRLPISSTQPHPHLTYQSGGKEFSMQRGILDATVTTPAGPLRFLGVHLKSKREVEEGDQEDMRLNEARLLRRTVDQILTADPEASLVVYGDLNDTRQSNTVRTVHGQGRQTVPLVMAALKDSRYQFWTHHWSYQDVYSRIDYILLSPALRQKVSWDESRILDHSDWYQASDHRPLLLVFNHEPPR